jgi:hypothetical protein
MDVEAGFCNPLSKKTRMRAHVISTPPVLPFGCSDCDTFTCVVLLLPTYYTVWMHCTLTV